MGGSEKPSTPPTTAGIRESRAVTNQQAVPVPYCAGQQRIAVTWLSDKINVHAAAVTSGSGKAGDNVIGFEYYASIGGLICSGPVDALFAVYMNNYLVYGNPAPFTAPTLFRSVIGVNTTDYVDLSNLTNPYFPFSARLYWGTDTQTPDATLLSSGVNHPAYRGFCYIVFQNIDLGLNQTNFPNIEVVVGRWPQPSWMKTPLGVAINPVISNDCNPIAVIGDLLQNPRCGLNLPDSFLNTSMMAATAAQLNTEGFGFSPLINREQPAKDLILSALDYFHGYADMTNDTLGIGLVRPPPDYTALLIVTPEMLTAKPDITADDWSNCASETRVTYTDVRRELVDNYVPFYSAGNREINDYLVEPLVVDCPWLTKFALALAVATAAGRANALPEITVKLSLLYDQKVFEGLAPGQLFILETDRNLASLVFRVQERTNDKPSVPDFSIVAVVDRSYLYPTPGNPLLSNADPVPVSDDLETPVADGMQAVRIVELPVELGGNLAVLAARRDASVLGWQVLLSRNYGGLPDSFEQLAVFTTPALHGTLSADFSASVAIVDDTMSLVVTLDSVDQDLDQQTFFDGLVNQLLVFLDDEIFSVFDWNLVGPSQYGLSCIRARCGTAAVDHAADAEVFIIRQASLMALKHPFFQPTNTAIVKVNPRLLTFGLLDATPISYLISGVAARKMHPTINGVGVCPTFSSGQPVTIGWTLLDAIGDIASDTITISVSTMLEFLDGQENVLGSATVGAGEITLDLTGIEVLAYLGGTAQSFTLRIRSRITNADFTLDSNPETLAVQLV